MRIDAHLHVNYNKKSAENIIDYLDKNKFDRCWLMSWEEEAPGPALKPYQHLSVEDIYETYIRYPSRIVPMYAPDPHREDASEKLIYWHEKGIKGCAELKATLNWQSPKVRSLLSTVSDLKIPLAFHMEESVEILVPLESNNIVDLFLVKLMRTKRLFEFPGRILNILTSYFPRLRAWKTERTFLSSAYMLDFFSLELTLGDYPNINFVGHGPLFWKHISADATPGEPIHPRGPVKEGGLTWCLLRDYDNLYADISGYSGFNALNRDHKCAGRFLSEFSHKILFGTDNETLGLERLLKSLALSSEALNQIFGKNALHLLGDAPK